MLVVLSVYHTGVVAFSLMDFQRFGDFFLLLHSVAFFLGLVWLALYRGVAAGLGRIASENRNGERALVAVTLARRLGLMPISWSR